ncbi:MAG: prepilin peptidase [Pseudomonadota bacterium]
MIAAIIFVVFPFAMIYAALSDVFTMTIANRVSLMLIVGFLIVAPFIGITWMEFMWHIAAFALILVITFALFAANVMGGGDAKLMSSTALWIGLNAQLMEYVLVFTVAGGLITLFLLMLRNSAFATYVGEIRVLWRMLDEKDIPYGVGLAIGGLFVFPETPAMTYAIAQML